MTDLLDRIVEAIFYGILGFAIVAFCFGPYSKFFGHCAGAAPNVEFRQGMTLCPDKARHLGSKRPTSAWNLTFGAHA